MNVNSNSIGRPIAQQAFKFTDLISANCGSYKWIDRQCGVCSRTCSFVHGTGVYADAAFDVLQNKKRNIKSDKIKTYFGEKHEVTWRDQNVWRLVKHKAFVLFPFNWSACTSWIKRVKRPLLKDRLQNQVNFGLRLCLCTRFGSWILDTSVDAHVFDDICVNYSDRHVVELNHRWIGCEHRHVVS